MRLNTAHIAALVVRHCQALAQAGKREEAMEWAESLDQMRKRMSTIERHIPGPSAWGPILDAAMRELRGPGGGRVTPPVDWSRCPGPQYRCHTFDHEGLGHWSPFPPVLVDTEHGQVWSYTSGSMLSHFRCPFGLDWRESLEERP